MIINNNEINKIVSKWKIPLSPFLKIIIAVIIITGIIGNGEQHIYI